MPTGGGLVNFGKEISSKIIIDPKAVIVVIVLVIIFQFLLYNYGINILGL